MAQLSPEGERCFWRLQTHCDDEGRCENNPRLINAALFPLNDDTSPGMVELWVKEMERVGLVVRYSVDGRHYLQVIGFDKFQKPRHPTPSKIPAPPEGYGVSPEDDGVPPHGEGVGVGVGVGEGVGDGEGGVELALVSAPPTTTDPIVAIFNAWKDHTGHHKAVLDKRRRDSIVRARKNYPDNDLIDAVRGVLLSPHHRGENDRNTVYDDIALVLRDSKNIEFFRDLYRGEGGRAPARLPQNAEHVRQAVAAIEGRDR